MASIIPSARTKNCPVPRFLRSPPNPYSLLLPNLHLRHRFKVCSLHSPKESVKNISVRHPRVMASVSESGFSADIGDILGDISIFTAAGDPVVFKDLWDQNEGVAVVALLRHFGCICCWELASSLKESKAKFDSAGVKLIAVGIGTPQKAQMLAEKLPFPMDCLYCDPHRKAYDVLGLHYGLGTFFNGKTRKAFSRLKTMKVEVKKNYTIRATPDAASVLQQGGMFVFKGKELLYARKDEAVGDHAPLDDVFDVCCKFPVEPLLSGLVEH